MKKRNGFTLIELLVVIAIIGILSAVILASMSGARAKGRDAKRVADLKQLQLALQLYYDANSKYPSTGGNISSSGSVLTELTSANYISVLPNDPLGSNHYIYKPLPASCSGTSCTDYVLAAQMENDTTSLNGYTTAIAGGLTINGRSTNCDKYATSPDFTYCVKP